MNDSRQNDFDQFIAINHSQVEISLNGIHTWRIIFCFKLFMLTHRRVINPPDLLSSLHLNLYHLFRTSVKSWHPNYQNMINLELCWQHMPPKTTP
jgi:hypothetical protein